MADNFIQIAGGKVKLNATDTSPDYLINKINSGSFNTFNIERILLDKDNSNPSFVEGQFFYDSEWKTIAANIDTDVTLQIGQEDLYYVYNNSGVTITDGQAVYITGSGSDGIGGAITETIALAKADNIATAKVFGIATQHIPDGSYGFVTCRGKINNFDTSTMGEEGDVLYLSPSVAGLLTNVLPSSPNLQVPVARLLIKNNTTGRIGVNIGNLDSVVLASYIAYVYLTNDTSSTNAAYKQLSYVNDVTTTTRTVTVNNNTVLAEQFIMDTPLGVTSLPSGVWNFNIPAYVDKDQGTTRFKLEFYLYHDNDTFDLLFTTYSNDMNNKALENINFTYSAPSYNSSNMDKIMIKLYGMTDHGSDVIINYVYGDGNSAFFSTPLRLRHTLLSNFNDDPEVQHMTSAQKTKLDELVLGSSSVSSLNINGAILSGTNNTLQLVNGVNPQALELYGSYVNATNYEKILIDYDAMNSSFDLGTYKGSGGGTARSLRVLVDETEMVEMFPSGNTSVYGSFSLPLTEISANYNVTDFDYTILCDAVSAITVNLPTAIGRRNRIYIIKNITTSPVILDGFSSQTIDGALTLTISNQYESVTIQSNGSNWFIL